MQINDIKDLCELNGISGHEENVYEYLTTKLTKHTDLIKSDNLGSFISQINSSNNCNIMLCAHMDEVGFIIKEILEDGFLKFHPVGGFSPQSLLGMRVNVINKHGEIFPGVVGALPPHLIPKDKRSEMVLIDDMYIDIGLKSKHDVLEKDLYIGDMIGLDGDFKQLADPDLVMAKAFDNRIGCYIMMEVMRNLDLMRDKLKANIFGVASVQEEIGLRGAKTASNVVNPDIALTIDTGIANDIPGLDNVANKITLGDGPILLISDARALANKQILKAIEQAAEKLDIPIQYDQLSGGGTDHGMIQYNNGGVIGMSIVIPTRNLHTSSSIISLQDVSNTINLITEFCINYQLYMDYV